MLSAIREGAGRKARILDDDSERLLAEASKVAAAEYIRFLALAVEGINLVARLVPDMRDRVPTEAYGRSLSSSAAYVTGYYNGVVPRHRLPRAIKFVAAMYTVGAPPAIVGLGRGLERISYELGPRALEEVIESLPLLPRDVEFESAWCNAEAIRRLLGDRAASMYLEDLKLASDYLGLDLSCAMDRHDVLVAASKGDLTALMELARARGFLG
jgi:phosphoenolpyruvate carboxylase